MSVADRIRDIIEAGIKPDHLEIVNESDKHIGHAGHDGSGQSHFKLIVVSNVFEGYNRIARYRMVHDLLSDYLKTDIHALSLKLATPDEYRSAQEKNTQ